MKKTTKTDAAKPAKATTPAKPASTPVKKTKAPKSETPSSIAPSVTTSTAPAAPAVKETAAAPLSTTIVAQIDVGFGNTLFVRGEGPGLSWEKGVALDCVADDKWSLVLGETSKPLVFKFLINDQTWCTGDDYVAQPGTTLTVTPAF